MIKAKIQLTLNDDHYANIKLLSYLNKYVTKFKYDDLPDNLILIAHKNKSTGIINDMFGGQVDTDSKNKLLQNTLAAWQALLAIRDGKIYQNAFEWRFEFPEVLNDDGDFVGFDVVIGNPPYISLEEFPENLRVLFREKFEQFERKYETSVLFIVQAERLLRKNGTLAYISPPTWQTGENFRKFRAYINTHLAIEKIINLPFNIFEDAYVDTGVYIFNKTKQSDYHLFSFGKKDNVDDLEKVIFQQFSADEIKAPEFKIILDKSVSSMQSKFATELFVELGSVTKSTQGLSGSNFPEVSISDKFTKPFLAKGNVYNYKLVKESTYLTSLKNHLSLMQFYSEEPKILIRRIINRQDRLTVGYCCEELIFKKDINPFICTNDNFNTFYLLGLLASKFVSSLYLKLSSVANKDDFRQTTLTELRRLPIPVATKAQQAPFIIKVESIINAKQLNQDTSQLEAEIDAMVYQLYQLTPDEISVIEAIN